MKNNSNNDRTRDCRLNMWRFAKSLVVLFVLLNSYSCVDETLFRDTNYESLVVSTKTATDVSFYTVKVSATVTALQERSVVRGICWSTSNNPVLNKYGVSIVSESGGTGTYGFTLTGLLPSTSYYARAFVTTEGVETVYGNTISFTTKNIASGTVTDIDGNVYSTIVIGTQEWMTENLKTTKYRDGTAIPNVTGANQWAALTTGAYCCFGNNLTYAARFGQLYNWFAIVDTRNVAPQGWHIPTYDEWLTLYNYLGGDTLAGAKLKESGTTNWLSPNLGATNEYGYNALPAGFRDETGVFYDLTYSTFLWSFNEYPTAPTNAFCRGLAYNTRSFNSYYAPKLWGMSVRCVKDVAATSAPVLTTNSVSNITATSATCGGYVSSNGGGTVTARGVCWSTATGPTVNLSTKTSDGVGIGSFNSSITGLTLGTTYYVRAYATNSYGTAYGSEQIFVTSSTATIPTINTNSVSNVATTSTMGSGTISSDGGSTITTSGVCWSTSTSSPTIALLTKTTDGTTSGTFSSLMTGLTAGTTYYVRAYATNSVGTGYGSSLSFTTAATAAIPILTTNTVTSISTTSATGGGSVLSDGGAAVTAKGICWSTSNNPTIALTTKTTNGTGIGSFSSSMTGLTLGTTYYMRAYATNSVGTAYGAQVSFVTLSTVSTPVITTSAVSNITTTTATGGGAISSDGGATVTARGICWSTSSNPTAALTTKTSDGTGTGTFTSSMTGLTPGTTYYMRAYATNSAGTSYGSQNTFVTPGTAVVPTLTTTAISSITNTSAISGGVISSDGGGTITARGVCWSTSTNPTVSLSTRTADGTSTGTFTSSITGLSSGTTYYVRAYATNSAGTAYGIQVSFTTTSASVPTLITTSVSSVASTSAIGGGTVNSDGGATVTARGVCWSTGTNPTVNLTTKTVDGTGTGIFSSSMTGLIAATTYYVRAYATNSVGTAYGSQLSFTTTTSPWKTMTSMTVAKSGMGVGVYNNKIYVVGGNTAGTSYLSAIEVFDPSTNSWTSLNNLSTAKSPNAITVNNKIYIIGGSSSINTVEEYDPSLNSLTAKATMPTARTPGLAVVNNLIYAIGGYNATIGSLSTNEMYNPSTNTWTTKSSMPTAKNSSPVAAANNLIYAFGGEYSPNTPLAAVEEYNPTTNVWTTKTSMTSARTGAAAVSVNNKIYIIGGYNNGYYNKVELYDPSANTWTTKTNMPTARAWGVMAVVCNGKIYVLGGSNDNGVLATVEEYDPSLDP